MAEGKALGKPPSGCQCYASLISDYLCEDSAFIFHSGTVFTVTSFKVQPSWQAAD